MPIQNLIGDAVPQRDEIGESPCQVHSFRRGNELYFLKTSPLIYSGTTYSVLREAAVLQWLTGKVNVPEVVLSAQDEQQEYMITRAVPGVPLAAYLDDEPRALALSQEALRHMQAIDISGCPFDSSAAVRLRELEFLISQGLIDEDDDFSDWPDLHTPQDLLARHRVRPPQPARRRLRHPRRPPADQRRSRQAPLLRTTG